MEDIYKMKLHDVIRWDENREILRVPGGWVYGFGNTSGLTDVFVPFNKEFAPKQEKQTVIPDMQFNPKALLIEWGVDSTIASDWLKVRSGKKAKNTETAFKTIKGHIDKTGATANECIKMAVDNSWSGFKSTWYENELKNNETASKDGKEENKIDW